MEAQDGKHAQGSIGARPERRRQSQVSTLARTLDMDLAEMVPISATRSNLQNCLFSAWLELSKEGKTVIIYLYWSLVKQVPLPSDTGSTSRVRAHSIGCLGRVRTPAPRECGPPDTVLWALQSFSSGNFSPKEPHCNSRVCRQTKTAPSLLLLCSQATRVPLPYPPQASLTRLCSLLLTSCNLFFFLPSNNTCPVPLMFQSHS